MLRMIVIVLASALMCAPVQAEKTLKLLTNTSPPYADVKLPQEGLAPELVRTIFARTDYQVEINIDNWSRVVEGALLGVYDGLAAAWYSDERAQELLFSEPYLRSELIVLKRRSDLSRYRSLADLSGARLGVRTDYAYGVDFASVPDLQLVEENFLIQNLLRLQSGSVDLVIGDRRTVNQQLHEYLQDSVAEFTVTEIQLPEVARHVAISRSMDGHEAVVAAFNKALADARKDGTLDRILKEWEQRYGQLR